MQEEYVSCSNSWRCTNPSSRPPPNSPVSNKRKDIYFVNHQEEWCCIRLKFPPLFQIGRTWDFDELKSIRWMIKFKLVWFSSWVNYIIGKCIRQGKKESGQGQWLNNIWSIIGYTPELINCSISYFHLEDLYESLQNDGKSNRNLYILSTINLEWTMPSVNMNQQQGKKKSL